MICIAYSLLTDTDFLCLIFQYWQLLATIVDAVVVSSIAVSVYVRIEMVALWHHVREPVCRHTPAAFPHLDVNRTLRGGINWNSLDTF